MKIYVTAFSALVKLQGNILERLIMYKYPLLLYHIMFGIYQFSISARLIIVQVSDNYVLILLFFVMTFISVSYEFSTLTDWYYFCYVTLKSFDLN
jgi:hypothetical protein